jgi:hypothetical protein
MNSEALDAMESVPILLYQSSFPYTLLYFEIIQIRGITTRRISTSGVQPCIVMNSFLIVPVSCWGRSDFFGPPSPPLICYGTGELTRPGSRGGLITVFFQPLLTELPILELLTPNSKYSRECTNL